MSYDPCPHCHGPTEKLGELCRKCCLDLQQLEEITDRICATAAPKLSEADLQRAHARLSLHPSSFPLHPSP
jgi:predicted amidophosphoribosyltransferase